MASRNVNKIKPWMLAKNTNQIVSSYVQNIYKQMPLSFNKGLKTCKVATFRPENRGPLSTWRNQQKQMPVAAITPRAPLVKKSNGKLKQHTASNVKNFFKSNPQLSPKLPSSNLTPSKRLLKTPNYKIYKTLRYGSSCTSSRSSILKRYDERKRAKQTNLAQINYLIRSFHTSKFEPTYARFLMPTRNQQLNKNLGSIPDALKFSNNMLKDLMEVNTLTKNKIAVHEQNVIKKKPSQAHGLDGWNQPPSLSKYRIKTPKASSVKMVRSTIGSYVKKDQSLPENRDYARLNVSQSSQFKHPKPANELFTAQHDRHKTELHEKHRRNRMIKLGLIKSPTAAERFKEAKAKTLAAIMTANKKSKEEEPKQPHKKLPKLSNQGKNKSLPPSLTENKSTLVGETNNSLKTKTLTASEISNNKSIDAVLAKNETLKRIQKSYIPLAINSNATKAKPTKYTSFISGSANLLSPIVALRAQMPYRSDAGSYRYHRHDFFSTKKY